jgi:hypothetical protein
MKATNTKYGVYCQYLYTYTWVLLFIVLLFTANLLLPRDIGYNLLWQTPNYPAVINFRHLWSIDHYKFCEPVTLKLVISGIILLFCHPRINRRFLDIAKKGVTKTHNFLSGRISFKVFSVSISSIFFLLFWNFRSTRLIGDSAMIPRFILNSIEQGRIFIHSDEILPTFTNYLSSLFFSATLDWNIETSIGFLSCLWGGFFIYSLLRTVRYLHENPIYQSAALCLFLFSGFMQIYFGDVENYALPYLTVTLYIYTTFKYISGDDYPIIIPTLIWVLSLSAHVLAFTFTPSLIYIRFLKNKKQAIALGVIVFIVLVSAGFIGTISMSVTRASHISNMLRLTTIFKKITVFSKTPLAAISDRFIAGLNEIILVSLPGIMTIGYFMFFHFRKINFKDRIIRISFINLVSCVFSMLLLGPFYFDWNLFAFVAIGISMTAIVFLFKIPLEAKYYYHLAVYLLIGFFHTVILILSSHYNFA